MILYNTNINNHIRIIGIRTVTIVLEMYKRIAHLQVMSELSLITLKTINCNLPQTAHPPKRRLKDDLKTSYCSLDIFMMSSEFLVLSGYQDIDEILSMVFDLFYPKNSQYTNIVS